MAETETQIRLPYRWAPRPYQQPLWDYLEAGGKRAVACWHRRAGKDEVSLHHTACAMHERVGNYAHMLPEYAQARKAIWTAINPHTGRRRIDEAFPPLIRKFTHDQEMMIGFPNGSTWQVVGSDNYNSLMGTSYAGMVLSEDAQGNPAAWGYFSPILRENDGWAIFISTPRGKNHFYDLLRTAKALPTWFAEELTVDQTQVLTPEALQEELAVLQGRYGEAFGHSLWRQEYWCSFDAAIPGSIWGEALDQAQADGRIADCDLDRAAPVSTAWDIGRTDDTSIWFYQYRGRELVIFDHHASSLKEIEFYVQILKETQARHGIAYATHWLPHDARPRRLGMGGKSILQQFEDAVKHDPALGRFAIVPRLDRQEGIQAARATFPYCRFHATRCKQGLESLRHYHRVWDEEAKKFVDEPEHDWSSHDADAFRYLSLSWRFARPQQPESPLIDKLMAGNPARETWGAIRKRLLDRKREEREWLAL